MGKKNIEKKDKITKKLNTEEIKIFKQFKKQKLFARFMFVFAALVVGF